MNFTSSSARKPVRLLAILVWFAFSTAAFAQQPDARPDKQEPQDQKDTVKISTNLVTVPVIVTDRFGRFITGLQRGDFTIREEGAPQKIEDFSSTEAPFNVALLIDTSRSTHNKLGAIRKAAETFIKQLQPNDRVMIVSFDEQINFVTDFTNNRNELERAVKSLKSSYLTRLYDAIHLTINEKMKNLPGRKAIVVLTDGVDRSSKLATFESSLDLVASQGIITYAIQYETRNDGAPANRPLFLPRFGNSLVSRSSAKQQEQQPQQPKEEPKPLINLPRPTTTIMGADGISSPGSRPSTRVNAQAQQPLRDPYLVAASYLQTLAGQTGALYLRAENIENSTYAFQIIAIELRNQYTLTYISTNEQRDGNYRTIAVGVRNPDLIARGRRVYRAPKVESAEFDAEKKPAKP
jgi:VWFA-related protein